MKKITAIIFALIIFLCAASIVEAQSNSNELFPGFNFYNDDSPKEDSLNIDDLTIKKFIRSSDNGGNNTKYCLEFYIDGNESFKKLINLTCYDSNNNIIGFKECSVYSSGSFCLDLPSDIDNVKSVNMVISNKDGKILFNDTTSDIYVDSDIPVNHNSKDSSSTKSTSSGTKYVASSNSGKFHTPGCEWAGKISSKNKVVFSSRDEAISRGYSPCKVCSP